MFKEIKIAVYLWMCRVGIKICALLKDDAAVQQLKRIQDRIKE